MSSCFSAGCQASICAPLPQLLHRTLPECLQGLETNVAFVLFKSKEKSVSDLLADILRLTNEWRKSLLDTHTHTHVAASRLQTEKVKSLNKQTKKKQPACVALRKASHRSSPERVLLPEFLIPTKAKNRTCMKERRAPREWHSLRFSLSTKLRKRSRCAARNQTWAHFVRRD